MWKFVKFNDCYAKDPICNRVVFTDSLVAFFSNSSSFSVDQIYEDIFLTPLIWRAGSNKDPPVVNVSFFEGKSAHHVCAHSSRKDVALLSTLVVRFQKF